MLEQAVSGAIKGFFASIWDKIWPDKKVPKGGIENDPDKKVPGGSTGNDSDQQQKKAINQLPVTYVSRPTPNEIKQKLMGASPYQSSLLKQSYVGLGVEWVLNLSDFFGENNGIMMVQMQFEKDMLVYIHVSLNSYPFLKTSDRTHRFRVRGIIDSADTFNITLKAIDCVEPI